MQFRFQLEAVLRVRRLLEHQARERLDEALSQLRALDHSLAESIEWSRKTATICASEPRLPAAEVQFIESVLLRTKQAITDCQRQKQLTEQRASQLRADYLEARRGRETVSVLRENTLQKFQIEQTRRQQSEMDDIFLGKLIYSRNAARQAVGTPNSPSDP